MFLQASGFTTADPAPALLSMDCVTFLPANVPLTTFRWMIFATEGFVDRLSYASSTQLVTDTQGLSGPARPAQQGKEQDKPAELTLQCSEDSTTSDMPVYQVGT